MNSGNHDYPLFKVAAVQAASVIRDAPQWFDLDATLDKAVGLIGEAGSKGARLIVFPECWLPCYPYWSLDLRDRPTFVDIWAKFLHNSVEVPGRETEALCAAAKRANAYVVMGINERDKRFQGRMYNSILYISPRGEIIGTHRKICITVWERFFHTPGDGGENLKAVFETEIGSIGGSICGEHKQLPLIYNWIMQGIQIHCSLWPGNSAVKTITDVLTRAVCNSACAFGVLAAAYFPEKDRPQNFYGNSLFGVPEAFCGGSGVVKPSGEYAAGPVYDEETIVYGEVDLSETDKVRHSTNLVGIYSRWDLINLNVRQEPYAPVVPMQGPDEMPANSEMHHPSVLEARLKELEQQMAALSTRLGKDGSAKA